jgi:hypothetical protein
VESKSGNDISVLPHIVNNRRPANIMAANFCAETPKHVHSSNVEIHLNYLYIHYSRLSIIHGNGRENRS